MAGSIIPAVLISGINSDLPGPILAQVSQNVLDSASGKYRAGPAGQPAHRHFPERRRLRPAAGVDCVAETDLPEHVEHGFAAQMPGADQRGFAGLSDQVDHHYLATFGTPALTSLISAGQMVGQLSAFGSGTYGAYSYAPPSQWALAGETAGSAASSQFGALGQQMVGNGLNRPATIEVRPGYQFEVTVTQDLVFPSPYGK